MICTLKRVRPVQLIHVARRSYVEFDNPEKINLFLFKNKKNIDSKEAFAELEKVCKENEKVQLFKARGFYKAIFIVTRFQVFAYCIGIGLYTMYMIYSRRHEINPENYEYLSKSKKDEVYKKKRKMVVSATLAVLSGTLGTYLTFAFGKRMVHSIYWLPLQRKFEVNYYNMLCMKKPYYVNYDQISRLSKPRRFDSTIMFELNKGTKDHRLMSTHGSGIWLNRNLFEYIIDKKP